MVPLAFLKIEFVDLIKTSMTVRTTVGRMDGRTDGRKDGRTDKASYRDAWMKRQFIMTNPRSEVQSSASIRVVKCGATSKLWTTTFASATEFRVDARETAVDRSSAGTTQADGFK